MQRTTLLLFCFFIINTFDQKNLLPWVNPFIGTEKMGHTYPGATAPFGAVQLSPDTDTIPFFYNGKYNKDVYKYCAGYRYEDPTIVGFSQALFINTTGNNNTAQGHNSLVNNSTGNNNTAFDMRNLWFL